MSKSGQQDIVGGDMQYESGGRRSQAQRQQEIVASSKGHGGHRLKQMAGSGLGARVAEPTERAKAKLSQGLDE